MFKYFHHFSRFVAHSNRIWPCQGLTTQTDSLSLCVCDSLAHSHKIRFLFHQLWPLRICVWLHSIRKWWQTICEPCLRLAIFHSDLVREFIYAKQQNTLSCKTGNRLGFSIFLANLIIIKQQQQKRLGFVWNIYNNNKKKKRPSQTTFSKAFRIQLCTYPMSIFPVHHPAGARTVVVLAHLNGTN